ncbi:MAG: AMP nucleosidase [Chlamydiia bacterium]|nr:AMP nucleosidase [Chlamydiia bacterium]
MSEFADKHHFSYDPTGDMDRPEVRPEEEVLTEKQYAIETLERYSGSSHKLFQPLILLTNFPPYVNHFAEIADLEIFEGSMFRVAHNKKERISMIDFKVGTAPAALITDLLSFLPIKAVVLLGMCAGLRRRYKVGEYMIPLAAIRDDGTSDYYFPKEVPVLANFLMTRAIIDTLEHEDMAYHLGISFTTNMRFWEFNHEFKERIKNSRAQCLDMECATLFAAGYKRKVSLAALLLVSDLPLNNHGIKTKKKAKKVFDNHMEDHIRRGILTLHHAEHLLSQKVKGFYNRQSYRGKGAVVDDPISGDKAG